MLVIVRMRTRTDLRNDEQRDAEDDRNEECQFCFLSPCVAQRIIHWLGEG